MQDLLALHPRHSATDPQAPKSSPHLSTSPGILEYLGGILRAYCCPFLGGGSLRIFDLTLIEALLALDQGSVPPTLLSPLWRSSIRSPQPSSLERTYPSPLANTSSLISYLLKLGPFELCTESTAYQRPRPEYLCLVHHFHLIGASEDRARPTRSG